MTGPQLPPFAVTGSTGRIGGRVARLLADAGVRQRLLVRDPARAPQLPGTTVATAPYGDRAAVREALTGVGTVFMVSGSESADRVEQHRSLRDGLYAEDMPELVGEDGVIRGPAGDGRASVVALDDIAAVAALVLQDPVPHAGWSYDLTGPAALTLDEIAETITAVTGRPVRYQPETVAEAHASRAEFGAPEWLVDAWSPRTRRSRRGRWPRSATTSPTSWAARPPGGPRCCGGRRPRQDEHGRLSR